MTRRSVARWLVDPLDRRGADVADSERPDLVEGEACDLARDVPPAERPLERWVR